MKKFTYIIVLMAVLLVSRDARSELRLPQVQLDHDIRTCLDARDWQCAIDGLIPLYYDQGRESDLKYYIVYSYRQQARQAIAAKKLSLAVEYLELALDYVDTEPVLYGELGQLYFRLSAYDEARENYLAAVQLDENIAEYHEALGQISYLTGESWEAISYWQKALELSPQNQELAKRLAKLQVQFSTEIEGAREQSHLFTLTFDDTINKQLYDQIWDILQDSRHKLGLELDIWPSRAIPVLLLAGEKFRRLTDAPVWAGGAYEGQIKVPIADFDIDRLNEVIRHEYTHALIYDTMADRCPWWLNEGLAQYFSLTPEIQHQLLQIAKQALAEYPEANLHNLARMLDDSDQAGQAYALAFSATMYLIEEFGLSTLRTILITMREGHSFSDALEAETGASFKGFQIDWRESLTR